MVVDVPANTTRIKIDSATLEKAETVVSLVQSFGISALVTVGEKSSETACNIYGYCHSPMKADIVIRKGNVNGSQCTTRLQVDKGFDVGDLGLLKRLFIPVAHVRHQFFTPTDFGDLGF